MIYAASKLHDRQVVHQFQLDFSLISYFGNGNCDSGIGLSRKLIGQNKGWHHDVWALSTLPMQFFFDVIDAQKNIEINTDNCKYIPINIIICMVLVSIKDG
jgi:hypothetical protein